MKKILLFLISAIAVFLSGSIVSYGQTTVKVTGIVTSAEDGLPMMGVGVMAGPGNGVITSLDGDYTIEVAPGTELLF